MIGSRTRFSCVIYSAFSLAVFSLLSHAAFSLHRLVGFEIIDRPLFRHETANWHHTFTDMKCGSNAILAFPVSSDSKLLGISLTIRVPFCSSHVLVCIDKFSHDVSIVKCDYPVTSLVLSLKTITFLTPFLITSQSEDSKKIRHCTYRFVLVSLLV